MQDLIKLGRIGVVFSFQNKIERLLFWEKTSHTISFLFAYSFVCLDPHLLAIIPLGAGLLFVMVPAFLARHPPPPSLSTSSTAPYYSYQGPALAPASEISPASETSKDFFRNMRDLQNTMGDYADLYDTAVSLLSPVTNFSDETLSSAAFLLCAILTLTLFLTAHLVPWRYLLLVGGNAAIMANNPNIQAFFRTLARDLAEEGKEQDLVAKSTADGAADAAEALGASMPETPSAAMSILGSLADISLDTFPEEREVEVFELQYRSFEYSDSHWDHILFSPMPYDPLSPARIAGDRPRGCRFFEDVRPPPGWAWKSKKWQLDLDCREWVVERMITGVGFESPGNLEDGGQANDEVGGWVWDLPLSSQPRGEDELLNVLGHGDLDSEEKSPSRVDAEKSKSKGKAKGTVRDFEERSIGPQSMGDWRRRRWVRVVNRVGVRPSKRKKLPETEE